MMSDKEHKFILDMDIQLIQLETIIDFMASNFIDGKTQEALQNYRQFYMTRDAIQKEIDKLTLPPKDKPNE